MGPGFKMEHETRPRRNKKKRQIMSNLCIDIVEGSLEVKLPTIYGQMKSKGGKSQRREEKRREEERRSKRESLRRKQIQVHEKVGKSRNTVFL